MIAVFDSLPDDLSEALLPIKRALEKISEAFAAAFPYLRAAALRLPRADHPFEAKGAGHKHRVVALKGGSEFSAEVCQRLGVP